MTWTHIAIVFHLGDKGKKKHVKVRSLHSSNNMIVKTLKRDEREIISFLWTFIFLTSPKPKFINTLITFQIHLPNSISNLINYIVTHQMFNTKKIRHETMLEKDVGWSRRPEIQLSSLHQY